MYWNSYPTQVHNSLLKRLNSSISKTKEQTVDDRTSLLSRQGRPFDKKFNPKIKQMF